MAISMCDETCHLGPGKPSGMDELKRDLFVVTVEQNVGMEYIVSQRCRLHFKV